MLSKSILLALFVLTWFAPQQLHAQKYWRPNPVNRDFDDNRNWQLSFPVHSSLHVVQGPHRNGEGPILQQPTTIDNLWITDSGRLTNATDNQDFTFIEDSQDLEVRQRILVDRDGKLSFASNENGIRTLRCEELEVNAGSLFLRSAALEAERTSIRRSPMVAGSGLICVPSGGLFLLEDSFLYLARLSGEPSDDPEFHIIAEDDTAQVDIDGAAGNRTRITIDDRFALRIDADLSNDPFDGEIQFQYSGGEIDIQGGFQLANNLENKVYINESRAKISNGFDLNGGSLIVAGYLLADNFRAYRGKVRCPVGTMEFVGADICLPDVHRGGPCSFEHGSRTTIIASGHLYIHSQGSRIDWDGIGDGARFFCKNNTHLLVSADSLDQDSFGGELKLQSGVVAELLITHDWELAGSLLLERGDQANSPPINLGSSARIHASGRVLFLEPVECVFHSPVTFVAGAETKLSETSSSGDSSQLVFLDEAVFDNGSLLDIPDDAVVKFEDAAFLHRGVTVQGKGDVRVADSGSLSLKLASMEAGLVNDGLLDLGWRSRPVELRRFEQNANGRLLVEANFPQGPQASSTVLLPKTEEVLLNGALHVNFAQAKPKAGDRMTIFEAQSIRGQFSSISAGSLTTGLTLNVEVRNHSVDLVIEKSSVAP